MSPEDLFRFTNSMATFGWALLIFLPQWHWTKKLVHSLLIPILLSAAYPLAMILYPSGFSMDFGTLEAVTALFSQKEVVLIGWIHYLAFDLMVGLWISRDAQKHEIKHWYIIIPLLLTFMLGPIGLLLYFILRSIYLKEVPFQIY